MDTYLPVVTRNAGKRQIPPKNQEGIKKGIFNDQSFCEEETNTTTRKAPWADPANEIRFNRELVSMPTDFAMKSMDLGGIDVGEKRVP
jgi:hypothetical protein